MSIETHSWTFIDPVCKQPGFHRIAIRFATDPIQACDAEHIDGRPAQGHELFACDSCGRSLWPCAGLHDGRHVDNANQLLDPNNWRRREP